MKLEDAKKILEVLEELDYDLFTDTKIYDNYPGKFMFGMKTTGIVAPNIYPIFVAIGILIERGEIDENIYKKLNVDELGTNYIVY